MLENIRHNSWWRDSWVLRKLWIPWIQIEGNGKCSNEIKRRTAMAVGQLKKMEKIWKGQDKQTKLKIVRACIFPTDIDGCEGWTLTTADEKKINAFEAKCYRRILRIPWIAKKKKPHRNPKRAKSRPGLAIEQNQSKKTIILRPPKETRLPRKAHIGGKAWRQKKERPTNKKMDWRHKEVATDEPYRIWQRSP